MMMSYRADNGLLPDEVLEAAIRLQSVLMKHTDYDDVQVTFSHLQGGTFAAPTFDVQLRSGEGATDADHA